MIFLTQLIYLLNDAALSGSIRNLLEQNNQVIGQISSNISSMKVSISSNFSKHLNIYNYIGVSFYRFALIYSTNNFLSEEKKKRKEKGLTFYFF